MLTAQTLTLSCMSSIQTSLQCYEVYLPMAYALSAGCGILARVRQGL